MTTTTTAAATAAATTTTQDNTLEIRRSKIENDGNDRRLADGACVRDPTKDTHFNVPCTEIYTPPILFHEGFTLL